MKYLRLKKINHQKYWIFLFIWIAKGLGIMAQWKFLSTLLQSGSFLEPIGTHRFHVCSIWCENRLPFTHVNTLQLIVWDCLEGDDAAIELKFDAKKNGLPEIHAKIGFLQILSYSHHLWANFDIHIKAYTRTIILLILKLNPSIFSSWLSDLPEINHVFPKGVRVCMMPLYKMISIISHYLFTRIKPFHVSVTCINCKVPDLYTVAWNTLFSIARNFPIILLLKTTWHSSSQRDDKKQNLWNIVSIWS